MWAAEAMDTASYVGRPVPFHTPGGIQELNPERTRFTPNLRPEIGRVAWNFSRGHGLKQISRQSYRDEAWVTVASRHS